MMFQQRWPKMVGSRGRCAINHHSGRADGRTAWFCCILPLTFGANRGQLVRKTRNWVFFGHDQLMDSTVSIPSDLDLSFSRFQ